MTMTPPHAPDAEAAVVGAILNKPSAVAEAAALLRAEDFYQPLHGAIFDACVALWKVGDRPDATLVANRLRAGGTPFEPPDLLELQTRAVTLDPRPHARIVAEYATRRRLMLLAESITAAAADPHTEVAVTIDRARTELDLTQLPNTMTVADVTTWDEFCARSEPPATWAVPGLVDVEDRVIVVAPEGMGKTMLLRQLALAAGQGMHPFTFEAIPPITTLLVDLENPGRIIRGKARPMLAQARWWSGDHYEPTRTWIWHRPGGIDLRTRTGAAELDAVCSQVQPSLVCLGPLYKSYRAADAKNEHHAALDVAAVFDGLRTRYGFGLVLEAHAPMRQGGVRDLRPFGTLLWQQWPEVGIKLIPEGEEGTPDFGRVLKVGTWRGSRDERPWPSELHRSVGSGWPWEALYR